MSAAAGLGRLAWRCRRGMRELDVLLERYVREGYGAADPAERAAFESLLELPDPQIAAFLLGGEAPADPGLAALTRRLAGRPEDACPADARPADAIK